MVMHINGEDLGMVINAEAPVLPQALAILRILGITDL
jgi:hypothetical protein